MAYIGNLRALVYISEQSFDINGYGEKSIEKRSRFYQQQIENTAPTYLDGQIKKNTLFDESSLIQYGQEEEKDFYNYELPPPKPSYWVDYPTKEEPNGKFKYGSIEINMSQDLTTWTRQTYSSLDYLGDLGGLLDALKFIFTIIIAPFLRFNLQRTLFSKLFR